MHHLFFCASASISTLQDDSLTVTCLCGCRHIWGIITVYYWGISSLQKHRRTFHSGCHKDSSSYVTHGRCQNNPSWLLQKDFSKTFLKATRSWALHAPIQTHVMHDVRQGLKTRQKESKLQQSLNGVNSHLRIWPWGSDCCQTTLPDSPWQWSPVRRRGRLNVALSGILASTAEQAELGLRRGESSLRKFVVRSFSLRSPLTRQEPL